VCATLRILRSTANVNNNKPRHAIISLASQYSSHPLDHLTSLPTRSKDHAQVCVGHIDAFVKDAWRTDRRDGTGAEVLQNILPVFYAMLGMDCGRVYVGSPKSLCSGFSAFDSFCEYNRARGLSDQRRQAFYRREFAGGVGEYLTFAAERTQKTTRGPNALIGRIRSFLSRLTVRHEGHRPHELAEWFCRNIMTRNEFPAQIRGLFLQSLVSDLFVVVRKVHSDQRETEGSNHAVVDRLAVADLKNDGSKVGRDVVIHPVILSFERSRQP